MLKTERIAELSALKGVKKIAVENFLMTLSDDTTRAAALLNLNMDRSLYGWNAATCNAIRTGIHEHFGA